MKAIIKTQSGEKELPILQISSIVSLSQSNLLITTKTKEQVLGISIKFEK